MPVRVHCRSCHFYRPGRCICVLRLLADTDAEVDPEQEKCSRYEEQVDYPWSVMSKLNGDGEVE